MRALLLWVGAIVLVMMLAKSHILHGSMCFGDLGCFSADPGQLKIKDTP